MFNCTPRIVNGQFLGAFVIVRKSTIGSLLYVRRYGATGLKVEGFYKIWYLGIFWKSVEKIQVWLKYGKNEGNLH